MAHSATNAGGESVRIRANLATSIVDASIAFVSVRAFPKFRMERFMHTNGSSFSRRLASHMSVACAFALTLTACGGGSNTARDVPGTVNSLPNASSSSASGAVRPAALADVIAVAGDQRATLSWETSALATAYSVQRATATAADGGVYQTVASGVTAATYVDLCGDGRRRGPRRSQF
jgi:hypothetical protein